MTSSKNPVSEILVLLQALGIHCHSLFHPHTEIGNLVGANPARRVRHCSVPLCRAGQGGHANGKKKRGAEEEERNWQSFREKKLEFQRNCPVQCSSGCLNALRTKLALPSSAEEGLELLCPKGALFFPCLNDIRRAGRTFHEVLLLSVM